MPRRKLIIGLIAIACVAVGTGWWIAARSREPEISHEEAMAAWPELVANKFQGDRKRIAKTFIQCFQVGDPASKYSEQLAAAKYGFCKTNGIHDYAWDWDFAHRSGEGDAVFSVTAEGEPPIITWVCICSICR